jgi:hypothetical protein
MRRLLRNPNAFRVVNVLVGALPGLLVACHLTTLLLFLNPELPVTVGVFLRGLARYGTLLGAASLLLLLLAARGDARRLRRALPWVLGISLLVVGIGERFHAERLAAFLDRGLRNRLALAGLWTTLAGLSILATAGLHSGGRRVYGKRSRLGLLLFSLLSVYAVIERRATYRASTIPPLPSRVVALPAAPRLVVVGIESATLDAILPLAEQGHLPFLKSMLQDGAAARLASFAPVRRIAHWTTLATGRLPSGHRLLGPRSFAADFLDDGARLDLLPQDIRFAQWGLAGASSWAVNSSQRRASMLWEVLPRAGSTTAVVGWPASLPLPSEPSVVVAERFFSNPGDADAVKPGEFAARARLFRESSAEGAQSALPPQAPEFLVRALAGDRWREEVFLRVLEEAPEIRGAFLYLPGLHTAQRSYFGGFTAVAAGSPDADARAARDMMVAYLGELDAFLARLWRRQPESAVLAVVSPYGTEAPRGLRALRARWAPAEALRGRVNDAPDGLLLLLGSGIRGSREVTRIDVVDVVPTLAYRMGVAVARDLDGGVRTELMTPDLLARQPLTFVPSYDASAEARIGATSGEPRSAPPSP